MTSNSQLLESLKKIVGREQIKEDPETLTAFSIDSVIPRAVVLPENTDQISEVVRLACKENLALVPWGSGSKMAMGNGPERLDLVICTKRLNRIIDMDTANLTVTAQAGVKFIDIQTGLASRENRCYIPLDDPVSESVAPVCSNRANKGCFVPLSPGFSDSATIGGIIAANSSGPTRLLYGLPRDILLGVRYVAPNGEIIGMGGKTVKNVSGYDMCKLMTGSMGSLGIMCEITMRLLPLPERLETCLLTFAGLDKASKFIDRVFETSLLPAAVELLSPSACDFVAPEGSVRLPDRGYAVAVALEGAKEAVFRMTEEFKKMAMESGAKENLSLKEEAHRNFWEAYSNIALRLSDQHPNIISVKLNYPISNYLEVIKLADSLISENKIAYTLLAHAGSGITMIHFLPEPGDTNALDRVVLIVKNLQNHCRDIGGNLIIERAVPELKQRVPVWGFSGKDLVVMERIKKQMDPLRLFCPGRFAGEI